MKSSVGGTAVITGIGLFLDGDGSGAQLLETGAGTPGCPGGPPGEALGGKGLRYKDRATRMALRAADSALQDAGLLDGRGLAMAGERVGVVVSSNLGNVDTVCRVVDTIAEETVAGTSPMDLPNASSNVIASTIAIWFGLRGVNLTLCNGATSGLDALAWASLLVAGQRVDAVLACGVETANPVVERLLGDTGRVCDGAAAVVVQRADSPFGRRPAPRAVVGGHSRRLTLAESVGDVLAAGGPRPGIWFLPERDHAGPHVLTTLAGLATEDLSRRLGTCSGALGVLQCAAAVGWLERRGNGAALLTAGGSADDATTAVLLCAPGAQG